MEKPSPAPIRLTPQLFLTVFVVLLAMAVPVTLVVLSLQKDSDTAQAVTESMRKTLEDRAEEVMAPAISPLANDLMLYAESPKEEVDRIRKLVNAHGGEVILVTQEEQTMRMMAQVPVHRMAAFESAVHGKIPGASQTEENTPETLEVRTLSIWIKAP